MSLLFLLAVVAAMEQPACHVQPAQEPPEEERQMDSLSGMTIKWTFADGPAAGTTYAHTFAADGSVTWTVVEGPDKGATAREKPCSAVKVSDDTMAISYLAASGYTLTVVLSLVDQRMVGFASNDKEWYAMKGTFELVK